MRAACSLPHTRADARAHQCADAVADAANTVADAGGPDTGARMRAGAVPSRRRLQGSHRLRPGALRAAGWHRHRGSRMRRMRTRKGHQSP